MSRSGPLDWDYQELRYRAQQLAKPPFIFGKSPPGEHCPHCPKDDAENCGEPCAKAYKERYGFEPPPAI